MVCDDCGGTEFEVEMGTAHCLNCGAEVDNEVAAAISEGLGPDAST
jgi:hypothetical protein